MFTKEEETMMLDLFKLYAPSRKNDKVIAFIISFLKKNNISYTKDENGNIFSLHDKTKPILSAHMDSVGDYDCGFLNEFVNIFDYREDRILKGMGNIGGDDKCGIFLALLKLKEDKSLNFIFSIDEEIGCIGIHQVIPKNDISEFPYALVLDRRGFGDIICEQNNYGTKEFENELAAIGKDFNYTPARGLSSDANAISKYISCTNLSVAYHNPHSKTEFVSLKQLYNTYEYMNEIIKKFEGKKFEAPKAPVYTTYQNGRYFDGDWDESYSGSGVYKDEFWCPLCRKYKQKKGRVERKKGSNSYDSFICSECYSSFGK